MNTKRSSQQKWPTGMEPLSLPVIAPPSPLRFPTFQELVEADANPSPTSGTPKPKLNDLFDGILGTLDPLLADYQANPTKYGEETHQLLEQLIHGSSSLERLTTNERRLLNLATLDFYSATKPKAEAPRLPALEAPEEEADGEAEDDHDEHEKNAHQDTKKPEAPVPGVDVPVTELPAYWWLQ